MIGIGHSKADLVVYIANRPPLDEFTRLNSVRALVKDEIQLIGNLTGNHWRKIFNCFAKLVFELNPQSYESWQVLRDSSLLTNLGNELLLFSELIDFNQNSINIICGKTYYHQSFSEIPVQWIDNFFAVNIEKRLIVSPYFDYRQLSNLKILQLVKLIHHCSKSI